MDVFCWDDINDLTEYNPDRCIVEIFGDHLWGTNGEDYWKHQEEDALENLNPSIYHERTPSHS